MAADGGIAVDEEDFVHRTVAGWHLLFALVVVAAAVITIGNGTPAAPVLVLLAVLAGAYVGLAVPAMHSGNHRRGLVYLVLAYCVVAALAVLDPGSLVLLFGVYPQAFLLLERRGSIIATIALTAAFSVALLVHDGVSAESLQNRGLMAVGNVVFALVIGLFIDGLVRESTRRKELVEELQATRAELAAAEREAGAIAERERLARDIHDTLAQGFTSIVMLAQAGEAAVDQGDAATSARRLREIQAQARDGLAEARALVGAMTPPALEGGGLADALGRLVDRFRAETGVEAAFTIEGEPAPLAASSDVAALRATQESLANAARHAGATRVDVVLRYDEDGATVAIADDGAGFDPEAPRPGYGLDGLVARVEAAGGLVSIESGPGAGTRVRVRVP